MLQPTRPLVMGILNVTPDSFSDGGRYLSLEKSITHVSKLIEEGAGMIDIGGESTRPGAAPVTLEEERKRVLPILEKITKEFSVPVSLDTRKYELMEEAVKLGVTHLNDISGGTDIRLVDLLKKNPSVKLIIMHMKGNPGNMQDAPVYSDGVVTEVKKFLEGRIRAFREAGVSKSQLWVDPGFGFGKTVAHNLDLLRHLRVFSTLGERLVVGTSRKNFLSKVIGSDNAPMEMREAGTLTTGLWALSKGASVLRVHEVGAMKRAIQTWEAIESGSF